MNKFSASFQKGQEAAEKARLFRAEIDSVFEDLNSQLSEASQGKLRIQRKRMEHLRSSFVIALKFDRSPDEYMAIVAFNPLAADKSHRELANWEQTHSGYPCKVSWSGVDHTCHDRQSLESTLSDLLEDSLVGETLRSLMARDSAKQP